MKAVLLRALRPIVFLRAYVRVAVCLGLLYACAASVVPRNRHPLVKIRQAAREWTLVVSYSCMGHDWLLRDSRCRQQRLTSPGSTRHELHVNICRNYELPFWTLIRAA
jgi:hypothetical protein